MKLTEWFRRRRKPVFDFGCIIYFTGFRVSVPYPQAQFVEFVSFVGLTKVRMHRSINNERKRGDMVAGFTTPKVSARRGKTGTVATPNCVPL